MSVSTIETLRRYLGRLSDDAAQPKDAFLLDHFATAADREAASKALAEMDEQATPPLEEALKRAASLEVRSRVGKLLERRWAAPTSEQIRQSRAVMVLERIGDRAAKALLNRWAGGPVGARLTVEAAAASKRLRTGQTVSQQGLVEISALDRVRPGG